MEDRLCVAADPSRPFFSNLTCNPDSFRNVSRLLSAMSPAEEFYERWLLQKTDGIEDFGGMNWKVP